MPANAIRDDYVETQARCVVTILIYLPTTTLIKEICKYFRHGHGSEVIKCAEGDSQYWKTPPDSKSFDLRTITFLSSALFLAPSWLPCLRKRQPRSLTENNCIYLAQRPNHPASMATPIFITFHSLFFDSQAIQRHFLITNLHILSLLRNQQIIWLASSFSSDIIFEIT